MQKQRRKLKRNEEGAAQVQMEELTRQVESLKVQRISADQEMKLQHSWIWKGS